MSTMTDQYRMANMKVRIADLWLTGKGKKVLKYHRYRYRAYAAGDGGKNRGGLRTGRVGAARQLALPAGRQAPAIAGAVVYQNNALFQHLRFYKPGLACPKYDNISVFEGSQTSFTASHNLNFCTQLAQKFSRGSAHQPPRAHHHCRFAG